MAERAQVIVKGVVQGVGFRPYVYSLAARLGLKGYVSNTTDGVVIDLEGAQVNEFLRRLPREAPFLSRIADVSVMPLPAVGYRDFTIRESVDRKADGRFTLLSPDVSVCPDCLRELFDPSDRRYLYPFINCTQCGPRFSITRSVPYDRPNTTMAAFSLCPSCRSEYDDPKDRRFHAQPNACPECGPKVEFRVRSSMEQAARVGVENTATRLPRSKFTGNGALRSCVEMLKNGGIVAIKGLGGFHLACDAANGDAVRRLRERKRKSNKPFALMTPDAEAAESFCRVSRDERSLLESAQRPIVLLRKKTLPDGGGSLSRAVAPGNNNIGVMLPYTPLHYLLFYQPLDQDGRDRHSPDDRKDPDRGAGGAPTIAGRKPHFRALVMTSGNLSEEPIVRDNEEAMRKLSPFVDAFLTHDRDIFMRVDDSVVRVASAECGVRNAEYRTESKKRFAGLKHSELHTPDSALTFLRRSRGYAPEAVPLGGDGPEVLAVGADLKNTFTLTRGSYAVPSQHIGDMENYETVAFFEESLDNLKAVYRANPVAIAYDLHPSYLSTKWALDQARSAGTQGPKIHTYGVQHHYAHIGSVMAEHGLRERVIGVAFDGTGYGIDGHLWGGEFLVCDLLRFERRGQFKYLPLPGGEAAIREPWRTAVSHIDHATNGDGWNVLERIGFVERFGRKALDNVLSVLRSGEFAPLSSGAGRMFDAVSAILGLCDRNTFEGEAAIALESLTDEQIQGTYPFDVLPEKGYRVVDLTRTIRSICEDKMENTPPSVIATRFHRTIAAVTSEVVSEISRQEQLFEVALSGGTFQNQFLMRETTTLLTDRGFKVYTNRRVPPNDGGISLGQAYLVRERLRKPSS